MADPYSGFPVRPNAVPQDWIPITPGTGFPLQLRAIRANVAGTVTCVMAGSGGASRTLNFLAGETRMGAFISVSAATATGLEGAV